MGDQRNYAALDWVLGEIEETLNEARQALESYVENPKDATQLRFCITHIHQVRGSLQIVEFHGASLLAEEMELLAQALMDQKVSSVTDAHEVLMRSLLQLPIYLDHVKVYRDDTARSILPLLNDIRALRKETYLTESNLFTPDLSSVAEVIGKRHPALDDPAKVKQVTGKLREMYQFAAASVLRDIKVRENLDYLEKVFARLTVLTSGTRSGALWLAAAALVEGLRNESIEMSLAVKGLLRYLARELRMLSEQAPASFDKPVQEGLLKNLLYYVGTSDAESPLIQKVKAQFKLSQHDLGGSSEEQVDGYSVSSLDPDAVRSVVTALREELKTIKSNLDEALSAHISPHELADVLPVVKRVADTLAVLGIRELRETMLLQAEMLGDLSKRNSLDESGLIESASRIIDVDSKLDAIAKAVDRHRDIANINERSIEIDEAKLAVVKECQIGLEKVKDAIIEYISSQWDTEHLTNIDRLLIDIRGGLDIVPLHRAGEIIGQCSNYIVERLVEKREQPSWQALDSLADTMASVEYYLERLSTDMSEDASGLLDIAEQSIASLGYPVSPQVLTNVADSAPEQEQVEPSVPDIASEQLDITPTALTDFAVEYGSEAAEPQAPPLPELEPEPAQPFVSQTDEVFEVAATDIEQNSDLQSADEEESDIDDEIIEIFVEEAQEVCETLNEYLPKWLDNPSDQESLAVIRRAYHTLKGSGRMVEAMEVGELAWSIENMLNRVIDGSVAQMPEHAQLVKSTTDIVPAMVEAFRTQKVNPEKDKADSFSRWAFTLSEGKLPFEFDLSRSDSAVTEPEAADLDDGDEDYVLLEIFSSEVETHLLTIRDFVSWMEAEAPLYQPPTDELQRALHTLKGSAKMAQVTPVAQLYEVLEMFAKEMVTFQVNINDDILQLMRDAVSYTEVVLEQISQRQTVQIEKLNQFLARTAELRELNVGHLVRMREQEKDGEKPVDPRLLSIFMAEDMKLLLDADEIVEQWCDEPYGDAPVAELEKELDTLAVGAEQANLPDMSHVSLELKQIYQLLTADKAKVDAAAREHLLNGHAALLDMVDAVAAGQNVKSPPPELLAELKAYATQLQASESISEPTAFSPDSEQDFVDQPPLEAQDETLGQDLGETLDGTVDGTLGETLAEFVPDIDQVDASVSAEQEEASITNELASPEGDFAQSEQSESHDFVGDSENNWQPDAVASSGQGSDELEQDLQELESAPIPSSDPITGDTPSESSDMADQDVAATTAEGLLDVIDTEAEEYDADILEVFIEEADELFEELDEAIHSWESEQDLSGLEEMKRALHTMKGGARLAGMPVLGDLIHDYESYLIGLDLSSVDDTSFARVHAYQDQMYKGVAAVKGFLGSGDSVAMPDPEAAADIPEAPPESNDDTLGSDAVPGANVVPFVAKPKQDLADNAAGAVVAQGGGGAAVAKKSGPQEVVRINSDLLEELVNLAGETSISRSRLEEQVIEFRHSLDEVDATIIRLQEQLRRLDIETEAQVLFRQEQMAVHEENFDPLEMDRYSHLQQLSRSLMESASDLYDLRSDLSDKVKSAETTLLQQSRINTTLQEGLMRSRMVPFSRLVPRLRRIVRQVASELDKKVSFELDNIEGELDRNVLERMVPPFEHMLRNAVDHGIESPEERIAKGKPETGRIVLTLGREGGNVVIRLADDGRGVDLQRVRNKAIERGLMDPDAQLSDLDVMQFILHAGFSTAENVTQISGRGVGMDVVHAEIKQLGGDVTINSEWGKGTEFVVHLPFTLSVNRALMVEIGKDQFAIPLNSIEGIVRVSPFELDHYYNNPDSEFEYANEKFQVRYLGSLLYAGRKANLEGHILPLPVILVRSAQHTMALQVDALMGSREIVVKSLGSQFSAVQGLSGATIMGDGSVVVILDPHAIVRQEIAKSDLLLDAETKAKLELTNDGSSKTAEPDAVRTIMVVDDSVTVRKVTTRFLEREGYNVITAKDGVDALAVLQDEIPDLMLLDIEMPRMDGFEVAKNVRTTQRWKHLPIIMITSRTGSKHREHGLSLGVNRYMGKPYQEEVLLEAIRELTGAASSA